MNTRRYPFKLTPQLFNTSSAIPQPGNDAAARIPQYNARGILSPESPLALKLFLY
jgi:hypothetical protein